MIVFVFVPYRNMNPCMDCNKIWHRGGPQQKKVLGWVSTPYSQPHGTGPHKGSSVTLEPQLLVLAKTL